MKYPMDDSRTYRSESGFALIEVIVAAAVLAIVALAVLSGIDAASSTSAREKARAVAASLAEQDQERMRGMTYEQVNEKPNVKQQDPINVDGTTYKIESEVNLVTDDIGGTPECGDEGTQVTYVHITSTVTTPDTGTVGTKIKPVKVDSLIPPTQKWAEGHGTLGVKVVDRSATKGVRNLSVSATSPGYAPPNETTDQNGCAVFKDVPIGTYTITLNSLGYLDRDGEQLSQATANVVAKKVVFSTMSYDVADEVAASVLTHRPGAGWSASSGAYQKASKARSMTVMNGAKVGFAKTYTPGSPQTSITANQLFPFAENSYTIFTGSCRYHSPDKVTTMSNATPLYPNYFSSTGGVNPDAAELLDPAVNGQSAIVRQPPLNIRIERGRYSGSSWTDGAVLVYAIPKKTAGYSTDACQDARYDLVTRNWDATQFGNQTALPTNHWVSQAGTTFDPGLPYGRYEICLRERDTSNNWRGYVAVSDYDNTNPDGQSAVTTINTSGATYTTGETCTP